MTSVETELKRINTISGTRRSGKTEILANSIFAHLMDASLKDKRILVYTASSFMINDLLERITKKLPTDKNISISKANSSAKITCNDTTATFKTVGINKTEFPFMEDFIGRQVDYLFLDQVDYMPTEFTKFIDTFVRPNIVVIQTITTD
jgi:predicted AAA+ superfamily ATPase